MADLSQTTVAEREQEQPSRRSHWLRETGVVVIVALAAALLLRTFVVQTFYIPSGSMEPTLKIGDRILVNKLSYHLHGVDRGNIVVFRRPADENCGGTPVADLVKRVIGLPGETISLSKGPQGYVLINGKRLDETWLPSSVQGKTYPGPSGTAYNLSKPYVVPSNDYYVMGDNRGDSCDSRYWGPIPKSLIVGKVDVRVWPVTSLKFF
jgi:signal peptidase I